MSLRHLFVGGGIYPSDMGVVPEAPAVQAPTLAQFRARSDRFLFARRRDDEGDLVYLEQGAAQAKRAFTKKHLHCPEPGCTAPDITTVSRSLGVLLPDTPCV